MTSSSLVRLTRLLVSRFLTDRRAATAIEYGLMAALIAVAIMSIVFTTGQGINDTLYGRITNALANM
jgi:pilus assembly protein Flp/PilA